MFWACAGQISYFSALRNGKIGETPQNNELDKFHIMLRLMV